jgi:hypothetical protein
VNITKYEEDRPEVNITKSNLVRLNSPLMAESPNSVREN